MPPDPKRNGDRDKGPTVREKTPSVHVPAGPRAVPAFYKRRKKRGNEIGQVLLHMGAIRPEQLREALKIQQETGGLIGAILDKMGACDSQAIAQALIEQVQLTGKVGKTTLALRARENPSIIGLRVPSRPGLTLATLVVADLIGLLVAAAIAQLFVISTASTNTRILGGLAVTLVSMAAFAVLSRTGCSMALICARMVAVASSHFAICAR